MAFYLGNAHLLLQILLQLSTQLLVDIPTMKYVIVGCCCYCCHSCFAGQGIVYLLSIDYLFTYFLAYTITILV
jgi:hypothetical protein